MVQSQSTVMGRAVSGVGVRPLVCSVCGFEFPQGHGCLSLVCWVLSVGGPSAGLIIRPVEYYQLWCA